MEIKKISWSWYYTTKKGVGIKYIYLSMQQTQMKLKLLDLFSGIGGFSLGFEKTGGFETIAFCEKDKFCQKVLAKHWNNIKIYDEIRNLKNIQAEVTKHWREPRERFLHELFQFDKKPNETFNYARLRMEGYFRLATPLLYLTYIAIGLAMLLGGDFNRRGQFLRISIAVTTVLFVQVATLSAKNLGEKIPEMAAALFLIPVAILTVFLFLLASPKRGRQSRTPGKEPAT